MAAGVKATLDTSAAANESAKASQTAAKEIAKTESEKRDALTAQTKALESSQNNLASLGTNNESFQKYTGGSGNTSLLFIGGAILIIILTKGKIL